MPGSLDLDAMLKTMLVAAEAPLEKYWNTARPAVSQELSNIAQAIEQIGVDRTTKTITPEDAKDRIDMAKQWSITALQAQAGLSTLAVQDSINAALSSVSSTVNGYLGMLIL